MNQDWKKSLAAGCAIMVVIPMVAKPGQAAASTSDAVVICQSNEASVCGKRGEFHPLNNLTTNQTVSATELAKNMCVAVNPDGTKTPLRFRVDEIDRGSGGSGGYVVTRILCQPL